MKLTALLCLLITFISACASTSSDQVRILEKSRRRLPDWLAKPEAETSQAFTYVYKKDRVLDLTTGLQQVQAAALTNLKYQLRQRLLAKQPTASKDVKPKDQALKKILDEEIGEKGVEDIYFEQVAVPEEKVSLFPEYYTIYVLTRVSPQTMLNIEGRWQKL